MERKLFIAEWEISGQATSQCEDSLNSVFFKNENILKSFIIKIIQFYYPFIILIINLANDIMKYLKINNHEYECWINLYLMKILNKFLI